MEKKKSVAVNFLYNMVYQASLVILPLITAPYLSRTIGATGSGSYSYAQSVAYYFLLFSMLGIGTLGNRSIAAVREKQAEVNYVFSKHYYLQFFLSSISAVAYIIYCFCICNTNKTLAWIELFYVLSALLDINWFYFGIEEFKITVIRKTVIKVITSICIFIFVHSIEDLAIYTLLIAGGEFLGQIYLWFYLKKYVRFVKVPLKDIFSILGKAIILFIPIIATSIYRYMDKIMLGQMSTMSDVGQYDYAEKIIMICLGCMTALGTVMLPKMANLIANKRTEEMKRYLRESMQFAMIMASIIAFGLAGIAERFSVLYFGKEYVLCGKIMLYLACTVFPIAWANVVRTQYLVPSAHDKEFVISVVSGAVINFTINYLLIPNYGAIGAVVGTIAAEFSVAIIQTVLVRKELELGVFFKQGLPFMMIGLLMYICVWMVGLITKDNVIGLILQILVGGVVFIGVAAIYCIKTDNSIYKYAKNFVKRKLKIK